MITKLRNADQMQATNRSGKKYIFRNELNNIQYENN